MSAASAQRERPDSVLIVDDTAVIIDMYTRVLEAEGFVVKGAPSGPAALSLLETFSPDLIVLDSMMPEMSGHDVLERLRKNPALSPIPVVFLTASGNDEEAITRAFSLGASDYLVKPINRKILVERVRSLIAQNREKALVRDAASVRDEHGRLKEELEQAQTVQRAQLPATPVQLGGFRLIGALRPCQDVGGDIFDVIDGQLEARTVAVVDVSGHGLAAAMVASGIRSMLRILLRTLPVDAAMAELNQQLCSSVYDHYACVALVQVNASGVYIVNAGLPPISVYDGRSVTRFSASGIPPGLVAHGSYDLHTVQPADALRIIVATDGLTEPFGPADSTSTYIDEMRLLEANMSGPDELARRIRALFEVRSMLPPDDATVVILDRLPPP